MRKFINNSGVAYDPTGLKGTRLTGAPPNDAAVLARPLPIDARLRRRRGVVIFFLAVACEGVVELGINDDGPGVADR